MRAVIREDSNCRGHFFAWRSSAKIHVTIPLDTPCSGRQGGGKSQVRIHVDARQFVAKKGLLWPDCRVFPASKNAVCLNVPVPDVIVNIYFPACFFSWSRSQRLRSMPPPYPVSEPLAPITRWQGTTIPTGLEPLARPTARTALCRPIRSASCA